MEGLTIDVAQALVRAHRPSCTVEDVVTRSGGAISEIYELRCATGERLIVKLYPDAYRWKLEKELYVYRLLDGVPSLPVPRIQWSDNSRQLIDRSYIVMTALAGSPLSEVVGEITESQLRALYAELGGLLAGIHQISLDAFGYITTRVINAHATNEAYMQFQFAKKLGELDALGGNVVLRNHIAYYVAQHAAVFTRATQPVLCHNDLHEGNVLVASTDGRWRITGIIDVENAVAGDPMLDLAKTDYYSIRGNAAKREGLLTGYPELPDDWQSRIALYTLYHALELWCWFASSGEPVKARNIEADLAGLSAST